MTSALSPGADRRSGAGRGPAGRALGPPGAARPETTTNSHSGRVRSKGSCTSRAVNSLSWARVPGAGRDTARTWCSSSKSSSGCHDGLPRPPGGGATREVSRGSPASALRSLARRRSRSISPSQTRTVPNVEDNLGSRSRFHMSASASVMREAWEVTAPVVGDATGACGGSATMDGEATRVAQPNVRAGARVRRRPQRRGGAGGPAWRRPVFWVDGTRSHRRRAGSRPDRRGLVRPTLSADAAGAAHRS